MCAWGTGSFNSCDALLKRVEENDPTMVELIILSMKTFGATEVDRLATALASGVNTHLETISASGHKIPPESLQRLGTALATGKSNVKNLAIGDSTMGDDGVCALCEGLASSSTSEASEEQQQLQSLDLSYKGIGSKGMDAIVSHLSESRNLRSINLSRNEALCTYFTQQTKPEVRLFPYVQDLDVSECNLGEDAMNTFARMLSTTTTTTESDNHDSVILRIASNPIGSRGAESLFSCLKNKRISELHLSNCAIGDEGLGHLVKACSSASAASLEIIELASNNIGPEGLTSFATALERETDMLPSLKYISIADNKFDNESVQLFAGSVGKLQSTGAMHLEKLDITGVSCGVSGASDLIRLCQLRELRLFNNNLGSEGFLAIAKTLKGGHPTLHYLDLGGNHAEEASVVSLLHALTLNVEPPFVNNLQTLVIGGNKGGPAVEDMVEQVLEKFPDMDIARDKSKQQLNHPNSGMELPQGLSSI